jgi:hypothetical protein
MAGFGEVNRGMERKLIFLRLGMAEERRSVVDLLLMLLYYYPHYSGSGFLSLILYICIRLSWSLGFGLLSGRDGGWTDWHIGWARNGNHTFVAHDLGVKTIVFCSGFRDSF